MSEADMVKGGLGHWLGYLAAAALAVALPAASTLALESHEVVAPNAEFTAQQVTAIVFKAPPGQRPNFAGKFLTYLDLAEIDFKAAHLAGADLYGSDFTGANLAGADLSKVRLDRAVLIRANLSDANLTDATILRPTIYADDKNTLTDAPSFNGANMTRVRVQADLSGADFRGANMTAADFGPLEGRPGQGTMVTIASNILKSCNFSGAQMAGANMTQAVLTFSRFTSADLRGVTFARAELTKVDFSGADVTGADFTGADLYDANFTGAIGLDQAKGLETTKNADKVVR
jgi:uncharacterized protein YjbI with pentapeptide repeats